MWFKACQSNLVFLLVSLKRVREKFLLLPQKTCLQKELGKYFARVSAQEDTNVLEQHKDRSKDEH